MRSWKRQMSSIKMLNTYRQEILDLLNVFQGMLDGHIGQASSTKYSLMLAFDNVRPVHSASHQVGFKTSQSIAAATVAKMMNNEVLKAAAT